MKQQDGYIALMAAIVVSAVLMAVLITLNLSGFFGRFNVLNSEFKARSFSLAEGCADAAILKLASDDTYAGNETLTVGSSTCKVFPVTVSGGSAVIKTQAVFQNSYTDLKVTVETSTMRITSFEEVPTLP